jgi:hypothetical protein
MRTAIALAAICVLASGAVLAQQREPYIAPTGPLIDCSMAAADGPGAQERCEERLKRQKEAFTLSHPQARNALGNAYFQHIITRRCVDDFYLRSAAVERTRRMSRDMEIVIRQKYPDLDYNALWQEANKQAWVRFQTNFDGCRAARRLFDEAYGQVFPNGPPIEKDF